MRQNKIFGKNLAITPPMGWSSYNTFGCEPCQGLIMETADAILAQGLKDLGYVFVNIDDGWMDKERDPQGNLVADPEKFPEGLKYVTDYIHSKGLKAGIYLGCGLRTYGEYPGSLGFEEIDAKLIAAMGFDFLKYDYRELTYDPPDRGFVSYDYIVMRDALLKAGRPMIYSICEHGRSAPWEWARGVGHMWRTTCDIKDGFDGEINWGWGFNKIIDSTHQLFPYAGTGGWNDPDMLIVGLNGKIDWQGRGCTINEYRAHFSLWCLNAAPLIIGCDIRNMDNSTKEILTNKEMIDINQDLLGYQGYIAKMEDDVNIWIKPLQNFDFAIGIYNTSENRKKVLLLWKDIGFSEDKEFNIRDLWKHEELGVFRKGIISDVDGHDIVVLRFRNP